jgi:AcrR family transcriptional regulator
MISTTLPTNKKKTKNRKPGRPKKNQAPAAGLSADIKQTMLNTTIALIAERGFDGFALRDVAETIGVHTALVGYYFKSKLQLEQAAIELQLERMQLALSQMQTQLESLNESSTAEAVKAVFKELARALNPGETSYRFYRWTMARGGKVAKDFNERLYGPVLQLLATKLKALLPEASVDESEARAVLLFSLAESFGNLDSANGKLLKLRASDRELTDQYLKLIEQALPEIFG